MLTREEINEAWGVVGNTSHGKNARRLLIDELQSLCTRPDNPSALARHEGRRSLARRIPAAGS